MTAPDTSSVTCKTDYCASRAFLDHPPSGFTDHPILTPRGALMVAAHGQEALLDEHDAIVRSVSPLAQRLDGAEACALVPVLRREMVLGAVHEPDAADIDVHALHQGFLRGMRAAGGTLACNAEVTAMRHDGSVWHGCVALADVHRRRRVVLREAGCRAAAGIAGERRSGGAA